MASEKNRKILEDMLEGYYEIDLQGTFIYVNDRVCQLAEVPRDKIIGVNFMSYTTKATAKRVYNTFNDTFRTGIPQRIEYEVIIPNGKKKVIENSTSLLRDESGRVIGFCGLVNDITRRRRLEDQIKEGRERFEALFENANEIIITTDPFGYIKRLNKKTEEVSNYTRKEMIGQSILMIAHPEDRDLFIEFWKEILEGLTPSFELRAVSKEGRTEYLLASGSVIRKAGR
jgi:PAS domain S-box-containing protein